MRECFLNPEFTFRVMKELQKASYEGVTVTLSNSKMSVSMNLHPYCECTNIGVSEHQVIDMIESAVREASKDMSQIDWNIPGNYEQIKRTLMLRVTLVRGNEEKLAGIPHETVEDMVVVYCFDLGSNERETFSAPVTGAIRKSYGIAGEQLAADAIDIAARNYSASLWKRQKPKSRRPLFMRKTLQRAFSFPLAVYRRENRWRKCK